MSAEQFAHFADMVPAGIACICFAIGYLCGNAP